MVVNNGNSRIDGFSKEDVISIQFFHAKMQVLSKKMQVSSKKMQFLETKQQYCTAGTGRVRVPGAGYIAGAGADSEFYLKN